MDYKRMFQTPTSGNKKALAQSSSEAGTSRHHTTSPVPEAAQATDSRCSSPDLDSLLLAMSPEGEIEESVAEPAQAKPKAKAKKADKMQRRPLPVQATEVKDVRSMSSVINTLARQIIQAVHENKSVTSINKRFIIEAAEEIGIAADAYLESQVDPYYLESHPDPPASAPDPAPVVDNTGLREEIVSAMREEMTKLKAEIKEELSAGSGPSYAQVAANRNKLPPEKSPKSTYKPAIVVSPLESSENKQETINKFKKSISFKNKNYAPSRVKVLSNNKVRVEFLNETQCQETLNQLKESTIVSAEPAKKLRPMLILKGVSNDIPLEELASVIRTQNPSVNEQINDVEDLKLRFRRNNNRNPNLYNAVFIVSPAVWREATLLGRLNIDHQQVFVGDFSPFMQCYKCLQFGHISKNCMSDCRPCSHCSDKTHQNTNCPHIISNTTPVCFNCTKHNVKTNSNINTSHSAISANCPTVQYMMNQVKCKIDYGV